jgi:hypothetical protein
MLKIIVVVFAGSLLGTAVCPAAHGENAIAPSIGARTGTIAVRVIRPSKAQSPQEYSNKCVSFRLP